MRLTDAEIIEIIQAYAKAKQYIVKLEGIIEFLRNELNDRTNRKKSRCNKRI